MQRQIPSKHGLILARLITFAMTVIAPYCSLPIEESSTQSICQKDLG